MIAFLISNSPAWTLEGKRPTQRPASLLVYCTLLGFYSSFPFPLFRGLPDTILIRQRQETEKPKAIRCVIIHQHHGHVLQLVHFSWEIRWEQERVKEVQTYGKYRFEWQAKQIYSLYSNYNTRGANPSKTSLLGRWRPTRQFSWEMELWVWRGSLAIEAKCTRLGTEMADIHSRGLCTTACCSWESLQSLPPSVAPHLWLSMPFRGTWLFFRITVAALRRGRQQNFPLCSPSLLYHLPGPLLSTCL